jgi:hypothetical protein
MLIFKETVFLHSRKNVSGIYQYLLNECQRVNSHMIRHLGS